MAKRVFFPTIRAGLSAGIIMAGWMAGGLASGTTWAQATATGTLSTGTAPAADAQPETQTEQQENKTPPPVVSTPLDKIKKDKSKEKKDKSEKVIQSKDTRAANRKLKKTDPLAGVDAKLPDKQLYDKAQAAIKRGRYDVARLDLQTLLNTYQDSQYQMRAKLAIADSWYREGGSAALTQAEQEYKDFITFFPNAPEAAEAQMRVGDIYFRQMDKPDRDYAKATHAEEEYRLMLQQFPESKLVPDAKQRLREVQEVLATREASIAAFYATRENWPATIARYQTVADTYPQFSHTDDLLVALGDAWEAEARYVRSIKLSESAKAALEKTYDGRAADAYRKVVLEHSASAHVEDAKDRLAAMNLPIPTPTPEQIAKSTELENSRGQYSLVGRARLLVFHTPDVVQTARVGEPLLTDPAPTLAPAVRKEIIEDFNTSMNPNAARPAVTATAADPNAPANAPETAAAPATPAAPLALTDVPAADAAGGSTTVMTGSPTNSTAPTTSVGAEVVSPGSNAAPLGSPADIPRSGAPAGTAATGGLPIAGPTNNTPLPAVEKAGMAPDAVNDIKPGTAPPAQTPAANGKKTKPEFDKSEESSSKHKKKKGLKKLDPL
ncbi:DNA uptake lipoprotein-like [Granulicella sibirica]|uniref:DNA uptake lipoprotein-like n=2 Tax=Granulicella sibirica TaxID=2479048 RepID=A0A4Q0T4Z5_9BACT|nr:DNA uptake lipoprotein-like [Granulicella sibirica]